MDVSVLGEVVVPLVSALIGAAGAWLAAVVVFRSTTVTNRIAEAGVLLSARVSAETLEQARVESTMATVRNASNLLATGEGKDVGFITLQSMIRSGELTTGQLVLARALVRGITGTPPS